MSDQPFIFTPEQEAWLVDLETTEEPQTKGALHRLRGAIGYCCLGRVCVSLGLPESVLYGTFGRFDGRETSLSPAVTLRMNLHSGGGTLVEPVGPHTSLIELNDSGGWSFKRIAAYIRANPRNVFNEATDD